MFCISVFSQPQYQLRAKFNDSCRDNVKTVIEPAIIASPFFGLVRHLCRQFFLLTQNKIVAHQNDPYLVSEKKVKQKIIIIIIINPKKTVHF